MRQHCQEHGYMDEKTGPCPYCRIEQLEKELKGHVKPVSSNANEEFEKWRKINFPAYTGDVFVTGLTPAQWAYIDNERKAAYLAGHDKGITESAERNGLYCDLFEATLEDVSQHSICDTCSVVNKLKDGLALSLKLKEKP